MFRYKENSRLMPCLEDMSEGFGIVSFSECKDLISEYLELEKEIGIEKAKLFLLENQKNKLLNKIMDNPELNKLLSEISKKENESKIK